MKLATKTQKVRTSGVSASQGFQMEASAKAFSILSDKLYTDKVLAIVRELSTNAVESHIMNGNEDQPFKVILPSRMDSTFSIRDYGTGLTVDEVYNVYTVYFKSTKTDTNNVGGCFGLGSKSPFSYTDNFLVESFKDGEKHIFSCHYNEERVPCITEMGSVPTTEPNGLKISISVRESDIYEFEEAAKRIYPYFDVCPDINTTIEMIDYEVSHPTWGIKTNRSGSRIVMGNISYPFPSRNFLKIGGVAEDEVNKVYNILTNNSIDLFYEVGDLEISVSRENIEETNRNALAIFNMAKDICRELAKDVIAKLDGFDDFFECNEYYQQMAQLSHDMVKPYRFKGARIMSRDDRSYRASYSITGNRYDTYNLNRITTSNLSKLPLHYEIYERDCGDYNKRIRHYIREQNNRFIKVCDFEFSSLFNRLHHNYVVGDIEIKKASDLPKPTSKRGGPRANFVPVCRFSGRGSVLTEAWDKCNDKPDDINIYVEIKANKFNYKGNWTHTSVISGFLSKLRAIGVDIPTIHGIKTSALNKTLKACQKNPKELMDWLKGKLVDLQKDLPVEEYARIKAISKATDRVRMPKYTTNLEAIISQLDDKNDLLEELVEFGKDYYKELQKHSHMHALYRSVYNDELKIKTINKSVSGTLSCVDAKYPLLKFVGEDRDYKSASPKVIAQYINAMEKTNG